MCKDTLQVDMQEKKTETCPTLIHFVSPSSPSKVQLWCLKEHPIVQDIVARSGPFFYMEGSSRWTRDLPKSIQEGSRTME